MIVSEFRAAFQSTCQVLTAEGQMIACIMLVLQAVDTLALDGRSVSGIRDTRSKGSQDTVTHAAKLIGQPDS